MNYFLVIFLMFFFISPLWGLSEIKLSDNVLIVGDVIKENASHYIVDLGYTIISIPANKVISKKKIQIGNKKDIKKKERDNFLYKKGKNLKDKSIKDLVEKLGHAVVVVNTPSGLGSGFLINKKGYLITNYHVIEQEKNIKVTMFVKEGKSFEKVVYSKIKIISFNPFLDLALLKIESKKDNFPFVYIGNIDKVKTGDTVFAIGTPLGLERTVSQGIISTTDRNYNGILYIQTTTPINPGNSGGPLFNLKGEVIGVTNMGYMFTDGLGFAIPTNYVKHFLEHKESFYYNEHNYNTGYRYLAPPKINNFKEKK